MFRTLLRFAGMLAVLFAVAPRHASAALLGVTGTAGFDVIGPGIGVLNGCFPVACDSGLVAFNADLADGMDITGHVRIRVQQNGLGQTTSAAIWLTNILATNPTGNLLSNTLFVVSDIFPDSVPGPVGVGIVGAFQSMGGFGGNISYASAQGQMNFLTTPMNNLGAPLTGFTLTTVAPFVSCFNCSPVGFWAANFGVDAFGGVNQLVGALNFTLGGGSALSMPGSMIITHNDNEAITSELPEPGSMALCASGLIGAVAAIRRRRQNRKN